MQDSASISGHGSARRCGGGWPTALLGCLSVVVPALFALYVAGTRWDAPTPGMTDALINQGVNEHIAQWGALVRGTGSWSGVVFGDSVFTPMAGDRNFVHAFEGALQTEGIRAQVLNLSFPGFTAFQFYYFVSRVLAAGPPDFAVVEVNLRTFSPDWWNDPAQRLPALAVGLSPTQIWRVRGALATQQIGFLTPIRYRFDERLGVTRRLDGVRTRALAALEGWGAAANAALGVKTRSSVDLERGAIARHVLLNRSRARAWYGPDFLASPTAEVLGALSDELRGAGVTTLYVLAPVQRQRLREYGITAADLRERTDRMRRRLGVAPEQWIDATDLFQASDFRDGIHVHPERIERMTRPVLERLVPILRGHQHARCTGPTESHLQS